MNLVPRPESRLDGFLLAALSLILSLAVPMAFTAYRGLAVLLILAAVVSLVLMVRARTYAPTPLVQGPTWIGLPVLAIILLALATAPFAVSEEETRSTLPGMIFAVLAGLAIVLCLYRFPPEGVSRLSRMMQWSIWLTCAFIALETLTNFAIVGWLRGLVDGTVYQTDYEFYHVRRTLNPAMSILAVLAFPFLLMVWRERRRVWFVAGLALIVWVLANAQAETVKIAGLVGLIMAVLVWFTGRRLLLLVAPVLALLILVGPLFGGLWPDPRKSTEELKYLSYSALHRIYIWQNTSDLIFERPLLGHGLNSARGMFNDQDKLAISFAPNSRRTESPTILYAPIPSHPHNGVLQVWLDLGVFGALALGAILWGLCRGIAHGCRDAATRATATGSFFAALVLMSVSFNFWHSWWQSALWLSAAVVVAFCRPGAGDTDKEPDPATSAPAQTTT